MEIKLELSDLIVMQSKHTMSRIFHKKNLATGRLVAKILIKYNINNWRKMKKRRSQLILSLLSKSNPYNDENAIDFRWSDVQDVEDITLAKLIENYKSKLMRIFFQ